MTRPYSVDLRERVLSAARRGDTIRGVAAQFDVSPSFVSKLETRFRRTGSVAPAPQGGDRRSEGIAVHADLLLDRGWQKRLTFPLRYCAPGGGGASVRRGGRQGRRGLETRPEAEKHGTTQPEPLGPSLPMCVRWIQRAQSSLWHSASAYSRQCARTIRKRSD